MGAALTVLPLVIPLIPGLIKGLVDLFQKKPDHPVVTPEGAAGVGLTKEEAIRLANAKYGLDAVLKWNFGIIGQVKAGKSSLINAVQGLKDNESGAAEVGVVEVTNKPQAFPMKGAPACVLWDMPGANTPGNPAQTYFKDKLLCAFDGLLLLSGETFTEPDLWVLKEAKKYKIPVGLVRTKSDQHISNLVHSDDLSPEEAQLKLNREARSNMERNVDLANFDNLYPKLFIASSRVMYCHVRNEVAKPEWREMDEAELLRWIRKQAEKRFDRT